MPMVVATMLGYISVRRWPWANGTHWSRYSLTWDRRSCDCFRPFPAKTNFGNIILPQSGNRFSSSLIGSLADPLTDRELEILSFCPAASPTSSWPISAMCR